MLLIIGIFASIHFLINTFTYSEYPVGYDVTQRCSAIYQQPMSPLKVTGATPPIPSGQPIQNQQMHTDCLNQVALERKQLQTQDLEKALSFTLIGLLVFGIHFYFARRTSR